MSIFTVRQLTHNMGTASSVTYTSGATTVLFWGLHLGDIAVIISTLATVCGVALQFWVALRKINRLEKAQVAQTFTNIGIDTKLNKALDAQAITNTDVENRMQDQEAK